MSTEVIKTVSITCDLCNESINPKYEYVSAQVYGADFHHACVIIHKPVLKALGLDEIMLMASYENWDSARKFIHV